MRDEAMRPRPLCMSAQRHATPNEPRNVLVESQVIMPIGIGTLATPSLVRARSPDGGDAGAAQRRPDATLIRALARAHRWKQLIEDGTYRSAAEIAEAEGITRSFVNRLLRLTLLAPDVVEAILDGRQPKAMQLDELMKQMPSEWTQQRTALLSPFPGSSAMRQTRSKP
jgi:hypothetical protein